MKIPTQEYLADLKREHKTGYAEGYAAAWVEFEKYVLSEAFQAKKNAALEGKREAQRK
jgi:hypothetical protein